VEANAIGLNGSVTSGVTEGALRANQTNWENRNQQRP
jgi:hypothetical protein